MVLRSAACRRFNYQVDSKRRVGGAAAHLAENVVEDGTAFAKALDPSIRLQVGSLTGSHAAPRGFCHGLYVSTFRRPDGADFDVLCAFPQLAEC